MPGLLDHPAAQVLAKLLIRLGLGTDPDADPPGGWPVHSGGEPGSPDEVLTVYDTASRDGGRTTPDGERAEHHGFQVRVRGAGYDVSGPKANAVADALDRVEHVEVSVHGTAYVVWAVTRTGTPLSLGKESPATKRSLHTINGLASIRRRHP
jgi:hypothetical protein